MEPSRSIAEDHIGISGLGGRDGIKYHRRRVCPFMLADDIHPGPSSPDLQLVRRSGPEGICCAEQHLFSLSLELVGQLSDGGGLSHAIDTDHKDHTGVRRHFQGRIANI